VKQADEAALRRRLHAEIDSAELGPAPVEAVFRRRGAVRARWLAVAVSGAVVIAAAAGVMAIRASGRPTGVSPAPTGVSSHGRAFATGTANGRHWRLAVVNLAIPGWCLPGVLLNGQDGDLLQPGFLPGLAIGNAAFLAPSPGRPGIGYSFLRLRQGVRDVTAILGGGTRLRLRPVTVTLCGQRFRLAGFEYPRQGVRRIVARSAQGRQVSYTPMPDYFNPASPFQAGTWINVQAATGSAASGEIGSGRIGGRPWRMRMTLGPTGECFTSAIGQDGQGAGASICGPVGPSPVRASLTLLPYATPAGTLVWYAGTVTARTARVRVQLSNGRAISVVPAVVGGRKYIALASSARVRLTKLVLYDSQRRVLAAVTSFPRAP
jgi:hypothetical protein